MAIGNNYLLWAIGADNQIQALYPATNTFVTESDNDFAYDIGVSEDGTIWVISTVPDPNGGAKIFWGPGDGTWNEMTKPTKEAMKICGTTAGTCMYLAENGDVVQMNTAGQSFTLISGSSISDIDYGGGFYWAIFPVQSGGIPCLQFAKVSTPPLTWQQFAGAPIPNSLSVNYAGDCYAVNNFNPMYYSTDGSTTNVAGIGANKITLQITFKNTYYLISTNANAQGNEIMQWMDVNGGTWKNTGLQAIKIVSSWYKL